LFLGLGSFTAYVEGVSEDDGSTGEEAFVCVGVIEEGDCGCNDLFSYFIGDGPALAGADARKDKVTI
jgi:hypothetical protein